MMKRLLFSLFAALALAAGVTLFVTRDHGPRHPVLAQADLPPLVPTRIFYADVNAKWDYVASADGTLVAYRRASLTGRSVNIKTVETGEELGELPIGISFVRWHPTEQRLRFIYDGHDWEVDPRTPERENWRLTSPVKLSGGWVKNEIARTADQHILTWGKASGRSPAHMWTVSQDGLEATKVADGTADTRYWVMDQQNRPVLRLDTLDTATERMLRMTEEGWEPLVDISLNDTFLPDSYVQADGTLLARSSRGRDKVALVRFDTQDGTEEVVFESADSDVAGTTYLTPERTVDVLRLGPGEVERVALTERGQTYLEVLARFAQPVTLGSSTPTASGRFLTQALAPAGEAYQHILIDLETGKHQILSVESLGRYEGTLVVPEAVRFQARDGLEIPAILTRPAGIEEPIPFVVEVHGGPAEHFSLGYRHDIQYLVNRGYGVLSVNFRGSTGFGKTFQSKGFRQFGRAMQDDVSDAARWLVETKLADPTALAVIGTSYGGYAAAMAMTQEPGLFTAGISEFPMLDVEFQTKHHPGFWQSGMNAWWRYFGKMENSNDVADMRRFSPMNRIDALHGPMMVLAGERDQITAVQQVRDFEDRVQTAGKDVVFEYFPYSGHGVSHWRDRLRRARLIEEFLAEHLGGRSGGFELVERAPEFID